MSRRSWLPLVAVVLVMACSTLGWAGDEVRSKKPFNNPDPGHLIYVRRSVDSTGTTAGRVDSAVIVYPAKVLPVPVLTGTMYAADTSSRALVADDTLGTLSTSERNKDRDLWLHTTAISDSFNIGGCDSSGTANIYTAPYGRLFIWMKVSPATALIWSRFAITVSASDSIVQDTTTTVPYVGGANAGASDSTSYGNTALPGGLGAAGWEHIVTIPYTANAAAKWGEPFGAYFEVKAPGGLPYWAPYTKIKIRYVTANPANSAAALSYRLKLIGRPF